MADVWRITDPEQVIGEWLEACGLEDPDEDPELYEAFCEAIEVLTDNPPVLLGEGVIDALPFLRWLADRSGSPLEELIKAAGGLIEVVEEPDD